MCELSFNVTRLFVVCQSTVIADMYDGQAARGDVIRRDDVMM